MQDSIELMKNHILEIIGGNHPSIYLFGSVVLDDFRLGWSDIDILCLLQEPMTKSQAEQLVDLRQALLEKYPGNRYFRSFEGGILTLTEFISNKPANVVYWGTSGQRITDRYAFDVFSRMELLDSGQLIFGEDIRAQLRYPTSEDLRNAIISHYDTIRKYAVNPGRSFYSAGWLLDIARCLYTLQTGKIIAKTAAGEWALEHSLSPNPEQLRKTLELRKNPTKYKNDEAILEWCESLGNDIQKFADVLEKQLGMDGSIT